MISGRRGRLSWMLTRDGWWVRWGDWLLQGLHRRARPLFSERHGYRRYPHRVGPWRMRLARAPVPVARPRPRLIWRRP